MISASRQRCTERKAPLGSSSLRRRDNCEPKFLRCATCTSRETGQATDLRSRGHLKLQRARARLLVRERRVDGAKLAFQACALSVEVSAQRRGHFPLGSGGERRHRETRAEGACLGLAGRLRLLRRRELGE